MATKRTGVVALATARTLKGQVPTRGRFTVQLLSGDLSDDTTFNLQLSLDKSNWDNAVDAGTDISDTLVQGEAKVVSYEADPGIYWQIIFAGATTGNIAYLINEV